MKKFLLLTCAFLITFSVGLSQQTAQERSENAVKNHLKSTFKERYKSYGFETLFKTSPPRIVEVDNLKYKIDVLRKNNMLTDSSLKYYDSIIKLKVDTIKANKEYSTFDINHFYVLKEKEVNILYYTKFYLAPDGKIKDIDQLMRYEFIGKEYDWFYSYYRRNPMLPNDLNENKRCFDYLDNLLQKTEDKEKAMSTIINTYRVISVKGYLDTVAVPMILGAHWLERNNTDNIEIKDFSKVTIIKQDGTGEKLGSNMFIKYMIDEKEFVQYFEFDTDFILTGSLPVETEYEQYFKKTIKP